MIAEADVNGLPGKVITMVSPGTSAKAFRYAFQNLCDYAVLRISTNSDNKKSPGSVVYRMTVDR